MRASKIATKVIAGVKFGSIVGVWEIEAGFGSRKGVTKEVVPNLALGLMLILTAKPLYMGL